MKVPRQWLWLLLLVPIIIGFTRLRFDVEILNLLPSGIPVVAGLKLYQQNFSNARELILTVGGSEAEPVETAARVLAERLRAQTNLVTSVTWQPGWMEHPAQAAELVAYLWLNQPPAMFGELTNRLSGTNAVRTLAETKEKLATSLSPMDIGRRSYDPLNIMQLPESLTASFSSFGEGDDMFASSDGTFRILFVEAKPDLATYRACAAWLDEVRSVIDSSRGRGELPEHLNIGYTGRPAFVSEISAGMEHDMTSSVLLTSLIIAVLFWLAHRRWLPMVWLLVLLALILAGTLGLGGLVFGSINVVSLGFAAILLGLAVDYGVVHYQEALASPHAIIPEVRRAIGPSIFWAATTTISAFLVLNFSGLPGLAQLGSLVALGVGLSAVVMLFAFLPPLFRDRVRKRQELIAAGRWPVTASLSPPGGMRNEGNETHAQEVIADPSLTAFKIRKVLGITLLVLLAAGGILLAGLPPLDHTANALRPQNSRAYAALDDIKTRLARKREPLWVLTRADVGTIRKRLEKATRILDEAVSQQAITSFVLPTLLWPESEFQSANRLVATGLLQQRDSLLAAAQAEGFTSNSLVMTKAIFETWQAAVDQPGVFWPTNQTSRWILERMVAQPRGEYLAAGFVFPTTNAPVTPESVEGWASKMAREDFIVSGWDLLGPSILARVKQNLWFILVPMVLLVLFSLWLAFGRLTEILLSCSVLLMSAVCLLAVMRMANGLCHLLHSTASMSSGEVCGFPGSSWNLLNLMALPLMLGSGVDYSIFMQLALRRHQGDLMAAHRSVGRALLLCGGTAVAGFGSLSLSTNAGMASLGEVCAIGIGCNMLISVYLLPVWWSVANRRKAFVAEKPASG